MLRFYELPLNVGHSSAVFKEKAFLLLFFIFFLGSSFLSFLVVSRSVVLAGPLSNPKFRSRASFSLPLSFFLSFSCVLGLVRHQRCTTASYFAHTTKFKAKSSSQRHRRRRHTRFIRNNNVMRKNKTSLQLCVNIFCVSFHTLCLPHILTLKIYQTSDINYIFFTFWHLWLFPKPSILYC